MAGLLVLHRLVWFSSVMAIFFAVCASVCVSVLIAVCLHSCLLPRSSVDESTEGPGDHRGQPAEAV